MKPYIKLGMVVLMLALSSCAVFSGKTKAERQAAEMLKMSRVDSLLNAKAYTFVAQSAHPMGWSTIQLTSEYDVRIAGDSVYVYLPYYGRAYQADYGSTDGGIKLNALAENYQLEEDNKGYKVSFKAADEYDTYQFQFSIGKSGYSSLSVNSNKRQVISFYGIMDGIGL